MAGIEKVKSLLGDLGKPTLRGVRKCPKCGTYNGTRGISCKNKACGVIFKERCERKKSGSADAVKIITGANTQIYSVRVRDRGPDYRGFVQLPSLTIEDDTETVETVAIARCFVDTCTRPSSSISTLIEPCQHIKATLHCDSEAEPLTLKNSILNTLNVGNDIKQLIWLLATETPGPLVQRVSKNVMAVKCKVNPRHPLGFLHFAFYDAYKNKGVPEHKFNCSCRTFKAHRVGILRDEFQKRCVHFYACICAFASDDKLSEEFTYYINMDAVGHERRLATTAFREARPVTLSCEVDVVVLNQASTGIKLQSKKRKKNESVVQERSDLLTLQESSNSQIHRNQKKSASASVDETKISISFHYWLASITERINQTMHYQFDGNPEPLVFHVPQVFFDCLQQRISTGFKKKRLPNSTTAFVRKDALPLGTFSKYTWHITNVLHVKQIFDTAEMPLEITRSFVENRDGTYDLYELPKLQTENGLDVACKSDTQLPIRPFELKTFLKVGNISPDQKEPTPFIIEWIPDILPKMKIGELRLKFEYGHQRNGQIEYRGLPLSQIIHLQTIP